MKSLVFARVSPLSALRTLFSLLLLALASLMLPAAARAQTASFNYPITTLGGGFNSPEGVAVDGRGNVYVADTGNNTVKEMPAGCASSSCVKTLGGGFASPNGVAVDGYGNVYVADPGISAVKEMPAGCASSSCVTTLGGGFSHPRGVAVDGGGNVYVGDYDNSAVKEMPTGCASSSCVTALGGGFSYPRGVAVDGSGNVYVADAGNNAVKEMPAGCASSSCVTTLGGGFNGPYGVAVDGSGNVYVGDYGNSAVKEMPAGCASSSCVTTLGGGFSYPRGVAVDGSGNVYVGDYGNSAVKEINRDTPPSLTFAATTLGLTSSDSPQTVQVANIGNQPLLFATDVGSNPNYPANFPENVVDTNLCTSGTPLAAGASCDVSMSFMPTVAGNSPGSVVLTDNALNQTNATQSIALSGTGVKTSQTITFPAITGTQFALTSVPLSATATSGLAVSFASASPTVCSVSGTTASLLTSGTCVIHATQAGNTLYFAAPLVSQSFTVAKVSQTISFPTITGAHYALSNVTLGATASSGLTVSFATTTPTVCSVAGNTVSLLIAGSCILQATQTGSSVYAAALPVTQVVAVHLAHQSITVTPVTATQYALSQLTLSATSSSGLPVSLTSATPSVCTLIGNTASFLIAGTCDIHATQAGNATYAVAPLIAYDIDVHPILQTINFATVAVPVYPLTKVTLSATATSGLTVSFASITPTVCTVSGKTASLLTAGNCYLHALQNGNPDYAAAPVVTQQIHVTPLSQTITFPTITSQVVGANVTLAATASSGLTVAFASATGTVCSVTGTTATMLTTGTCVIHATQAGNNAYSAAPLVSQSFTVKAN